MNYSERASYYNLYRKADNRLTLAIIDALGLDSNSRIVDVGAGTGNYSISLIDYGYDVISVEPEISMIKQCSDKRVKWIASPASQIPLESNSCDGAILINVIHHFSDFNASISEINRVVGSGPIAIVTFDPIVACNQWIFDYWPMLINYEKSSYLRIDELKMQISEITHKTVYDSVFCIPSDFEDVFAATLWRRPEILLSDKFVRYSMSIFSSLNDNDFYTGLDRLREDYLSNKWTQKYSELANKESADVGCRLVIAK